LASIRTCCPHLTESCSPIARVAMSSALPGGTGSTILMGLFGRLSCASAAAALIGAEAIRAAHKKRGTLSSIDYARAKRSSADDPHQWGWESLATNCAMVAYEECIGAKKHLVLGAVSHTGPPQGSDPI